MADCVASCHAGCADGADDVGCHFFGCEDVDAYGVVLAGGFLHELSEVFSDSLTLLCHGWSMFLRVWCGVFRFPISLLAVQGFKGLFV